MLRTTPFISPVLDKEPCSVESKVDGCPIVSACWTSYQTVVSARTQETVPPGRFCTASPSGKEVDPMSAPNVLLAYLSPDTVLPLTSIVATIAGGAMLLTRGSIRFLVRCFRDTFRRPQRGRRGE
jgi:hypothetical protein